MTISSSATDIRSRFPQGKVGKPVEVNVNDVTRTLINSDPQAVQVTTYTVDSASNSTTYTLTVDGFTASYTSDASATTAEIAAGIKAAIDANPSITGRLTATVASNVVTLTGNYPGISFSASDSSGDTTIATTTAAATADAVAFGRLMVTGGYQTDEANELGKLCKAAAFTAQVATITVDYAAGEVYYISIQMTDGSAPLTVAVAADTDDATTATAIRAALNAIMPANTVLVTGATDQVILTAEVPGKAFITSVGLKSGTIARLALVETTPRSYSTDVNIAARGISLFSYDVEVPTVAGTEASYPANSGVQVMQKGLVWVSNSQDPTFGADVYVETGVTADNGKLFTTSSSTRIRLTGAKWERNERSTQTDNIAAVRVSF